MAVKTKKEKTEKKEVWSKLIEHFNNENELWNIYWELDKEDETKVNKVLEKLIKFADDSEKLWDIYQKAPTFSVVGNKALGKIIDLADDEIDEFREIMKKIFYTPSEEIIEKFHGKVFEITLRRIKLTNNMEELWKIYKEYPNKDYYFSADVQVTLIKKKVLGKLIDLAGDDLSKTSTIYRAIDDKTRPFDRESELLEKINKLLLAKIESTDSYNRLWEISQEEAASKETKKQAREKFHKVVSDDIESAENDINNLWGIYKRLPEKSKVKNRVLRKIDKIL